MKCDVSEYNDILKKTAQPTYQYLVTFKAKILKERITRGVCL
jgi:hypothetical protein